MMQHNKKSGVPWFAVRAVVIAAVAVAVGGLSATGYILGKDDPGPSSNESGRGGETSPTDAGSSAEADEESPFLSTSGSQIVDSRGKQVRLAGITWFGGEIPTTNTPQGTWKRPWADIVDQVVDLGYNTIRLPYRDEMLSPKARTGDIDFELNPDLEGLSPIEVFDRIIEYAGERGLRVILVRAMSEDFQKNGLWFNKKVPEERWIANLTALAKRYQGNPAVIGIELSNVPYDKVSAEEGPCWGCADADRDWKSAAERAGSAVQRANSDWLIFVQGVEWSRDTGLGSPGGNLSGVTADPVRLDQPGKLVYTTNDYGPSFLEQDWFKDPELPGNLPAHWDAQWGYLVDSEIAPVMVAEFGATLNDPRDEVWMRTLLDYLGSGPSGVSFAFYALNPNDFGTEGLWKDDWKSINQAKQEILEPVLAEVDSIPPPE
jgi:endoglucanase